MICPTIPLMRKPGASIALIFAARALLQAERNGLYGDVMERALYNTCLAGMNVTQDAFFYVNPLSVLPEASEKDPTKKHVLPTRPGWFGCSCCPPNPGPAAQFPGASMLTAPAGQEVRVHLYLDGTAELDTDNGPVRLTVHTEYPASGEIRLESTATVTWRFACLRGATEAMTCL